MAKNQFKQNSHVLQLSATRKKRAALLMARVFWQDSLNHQTYRVAKPSSNFCGTA
jgi:hypothetical protein